VIRRGTAPWEQPISGGPRPPGLLGLPGRERVRLTEERRVLAPLSVLVGLEETVDDEDQVVRASLPITHWLEQDGGSLPEGVLSVLCDTVLGTAIHVTLAPWESMATTWLWVSVSPGLRPSGRLHATAHLVQRAEDTAVSSAEVRDDSGGLLAVAGCRALVTESPAIGLPDCLPEPQSLPAVLPWQRHPHRDTPPARGPDQDGLSRLLQLERTEGWLGRQTEFIGLQLTGVLAGEVQCSLPASAWLTSAAGTVQGGAGAWLGLAACRAAATSQLAASEECRITDCSVAYLRPVTPSSGHLRARASVERRGRRLIVVSGRVLDDEGRAALLISASTAITASSATAGTYDVVADQTGPRPSPGPRE
jgi:uncharacterized protein (TIGR00369 family)